MTGTRLPTATSRQRNPGILAVASSLLGFLLAFLGCEVLLRLLDLGYARSPIVSDPDLHHSHPKDFTFVEHHPGREFGGHRVRYDETGCISNPAGRERTAPARVRIAFLGDSFVEALQVPWEQSFVGLLEAAASDDVEIRNYGVSSYSPIIYPIQWNRQIRQFDPTHVFLMLYSNDVSDDRRYNELASRSESGGVAAVPGPGTGWLRGRLRSSYLLRFVRMQQMRIDWLLVHHRQQGASHSVGRYVEENPEITGITAGFVLDLYDLVRASGGRLILTAVPSKYAIISKTHSNGDPEFSDKVRRWANDIGIPFMDLTIAFRERAALGASLFFAEDIHFNEVGHAVVAEVVRKLPSRIIGAEPDPSAFFDRRR